LALLLFAPFISLYIFCMACVVTGVGFSDHLESTTVVIAQQWMHGRPLYHTADYPDEYSMLYGPASFLSVALALNVSSDYPIVASKLAGGLWALLGLIVLAYTLKKQWNSTAAWIGTGIVTAEVFYFEPFYLFGVRSDGIIFSMICLGLCGLTSGRIIGGALIALSLAIIVNCKLHAFLYELPVLILWFRRHGLRPSILLLGVATALSFLPFLLPNVSLSNYLFWLQMAAKHPRSSVIFLQNVAYLLIILAPMGLLAYRMPLSLSWSQASEETILLVGLLLAGLLVAAVASKEGAGYHHLLPFLPYIGYLFCAGLQRLTDKPELDWGTVFGISLMLYLLVISLTISGQIYYDRNHSNAAFVQADLLQVLEKYPAEQVQMGAGDDNGYPITLAAPLVYRSGQPCVLNIGSFMDMKEAGLTDEALRKSLILEKFPYWLTPKGELPFTMSAAYSTKPLFDDGVVKAFAQHYTKVDSSWFFDIYQAKVGGP
jgi:hypothetical protein